MSEAKDLLNSLSETEYASYSKVTPINDTLLIDAETRTINVPSTEILFGVETDKDVERKYFKCPRIVGDNIDLSTLQLRVHYRNANGETDKYIVEDVKVVGCYITFSWLLSAKVLRYKGAIQFTVVAVSINQDGTLNKEWNTTLASGNALEGLEVEDLDYAEEEEARDVIAQLLQLLETRTDESVAKVQTAVNDYLTANPISGLTWGLPEEGEIFELDTSTYIPCEGISISPTTITFTTGNTVTLTATVTPFDTSDKIVWTTSNGAIATVSNGIVTPVQNGTCTITATCGNYKATCKAVVSLPEPIPATAVTLSETSLKFTDESTVVLTASVEPSDSTDTVKWTSDNEEVATVDSGIVTPVANGSCNIIATAGSVSASCAVTVMLPVEYTKDGLQGYYDLTAYEDGYIGEVEDLSGNGIIPTLTGQTSYTTGRNGFVGGKFMVNSHRTSASTFTIPNVAMATPPFSIELYAHLRDQYNFYAVDGNIEFTNAIGTVVGSGPQMIVGTNIANQGVRMLANYDAKTLNVIGPLNEPNFSGTVENLQIDNRTDNEITDVYHHIVYCIGATEQKIYCDGILVATNNSNDYTTRFTTTNDYKLFVDDRLKADLKMVRIYNSILTDEQVANNYSHTIGTYGGDA